MTPNEYFSAKSEEDVKKVCKEAGTNYANFKHIALYSGSVSKKLAARLEKASNGEMTVTEILFPNGIDEAS